MNFKHLNIVATKILKHQHLKTRTNLTPVSDNRDALTAILVYLFVIVNILEILLLMLNQT